MSQPKKRVRYATPEEIRERYGSITMKAIVAEADGEIIGFGGLAYYPGQKTAVAVISDRLKKEKRLLIEAVRFMRGLLTGHTLAIADQDIDKSAQFLEYVGFTPLGENIYEFTGRNR